MPNRRLRRRRPDQPRRIAYRVLRAVAEDGAYANLELGRALDGADLEPRDAAFVTELVAGTSRLSGTYDRVLAAASGRRGFEAPLADALRLGAHQLLSMRVPTHAAVGATVDLAAAEVGEKVAGLTNAVLRKVAARDLDGWIAELARGEDELGALALRTHHPRWIAAAYRDLLGAEAEAALAANNVAPVTTLVVRPGLAARAELGGEPTAHSPWGARRAGNPGDVEAVAQGRAGVQDEGSQLVVAALAAPDAPAGPWLDLCAGPGGKAALLAGVAIEAGTRLLASERQPHRAELVARALRAYAGPLAPAVIAADGTRPAWPAGAFARVIADVPCTGLGALRRRPEARWRRTEKDLADLVPLQQALLRTALDSAAPGGVVAYVTCSPHRAETVGVLDAVLAGRDDVTVLDAPAALPGVPDATLGPYLQLWPHRHGTDAMFCALLRVG
ncbi:RsmB/NOP family class I SAM-dependent RNA methyltransferase [Propioniciclava coleopterorum]|uniref:RsmB/NOP family class I SAM-dependent RNA methyltransferase n=2 Tax=Propioniciclava coleopterorum TaxID=2714937 RepID=A0A6G7YA37_9ACTN|nr:RsmB/NOP family class I SAM-dependent RNA methyltransferase [Propioniciclava coleopterorum]QIK73546.1 RsmB/NOP family class I SAM-dependent RNA methyltransferase [Propioniciclava coleopterorum]